MDAYTVILVAILAIGLKMAYTPDPIQEAQEPPGARKNNKKKKTTYIPEADYVPCPEMNDFDASKFLVGAGARVEGDFVVA